MEKSIIIDYKEYKCSDSEILLTDEEVIFEIVDKMATSKWTCYVVAAWL